MPLLRRLRIVRLRIVAPVLVLASLGSPPAPAAAQTPRVLDAGTRVRVRLDRQPLRWVGTIAEVRADSLVLAVPQMRIERWTMPVSDIAELDVSGGHRRLTAIGLAVGAVVGVALTAGYNGIVQSQCFSNCRAPVSIGIGAIIGSIAFGGSLYFVRVERWLPIALPNRRQPGS